MRRELDIDDGDQLRWHLEDDRTSEFTLSTAKRHVRRLRRAAPVETTDVTSDHDALGRRRR